MIKLAELRQRNQKELERLLIREREKLRQLRFDLASGKVKNIRKIREVKKDIARILTILNEKSKTKNQKTNRK
jgi:large subunit ribosomal protein L29